jgi:hypothetical protein
VPLATRLHGVKYGSSAERSRQGPFVRGRDLDVCVRRQPLLDQPRERIKPRKSMQLLGVAELCRVQRSPEKGKRFVVYLQRHRERMSILPAVRKCEACGIGEPGRSTVDDLCHQLDRLHRARRELFQKQKGGKVADISLVGER